MKRVTQGPDVVVRPPKKPRPQVYVLSAFDPASGRLVDQEFATAAARETHAARLRRKAQPCYLTQRDAS